MLPLASIIVPCYNAAPWLAATLESALAQTWPRTEIIVVDDGSTDGSPAIARRFESRGVHVAAQPNRGASAARNHALRLATGNFIQYLDADDVLAPEKIARQLARLEAGEDDVLLSGAWGRFEDEVANIAFRTERLYGDFSPVDFLITKFQTHAMMHPAAWLVSRRLANAAGQWDERLSLDDDGEYFSRVVLAAREIRFCADALSYYRSALRHSLSRSRSERAWRSQFLSTNLAVDRLLAREDSARTRQAAADVLQRLVLEAYPHCPLQRARTQTRVTELGGSDVRFEAGPRFKWLAHMVGWRLAKRLRNRFV